MRMRFRRYFYLTTDNTFFIDCGANDTFTGRNNDQSRDRAVLTFLEQLLARGAGCGALAICESMGNSGAVTTVYYGVEEGESLID